MGVYSCLSKREITSLIAVTLQSILARMRALIQNFLLINISEFISALQDIMVVLWYVSVYVVEQKRSSDPSWWVKTCDWRITNYFIVDMQHILINLLFINENSGFWLVRCNYWHIFSPQCIMFSHDITVRQYLMNFDVLLSQM